MKFIPLITYDGPLGTTELAFSLPQKLWTPEEGIGFGDEDESAAGIIFAYVVRYEYCVRVILRFTDDERLEVMEALKWIIQNKDDAVLYRFDSDDIATEFSVYVDEPKVGERIRPMREEGDASVWSVPLLIRSSAAQRIHVPFFLEVVEPEPEPIVYELVENASGLLARHDYDGLAPFVLANWTFMTGSSGAISGGALRITMNTGAIRYARYDLLAGRGKMYVQGVVRGVTVVGSNLQIGVAAHMEVGASPDSAVNVRYSMARAGSDVVATQSQLNGVNDASVVTNIAARVVAVDHRLSLFVDGDDYIGYDHTSAVEQNATGAPVTGLITGQLGIAGNSGGGNGGVCDIRRLYAMSDRYITVSGLPAGSTVNVLDGASAVIVSGAAVAGAVSLDVWKKILPAVTIEVRDASAVLLATLAPAAGIWGGSQFTLEVV